MELKRQHLIEEIIELGGNIRGYEKHSSQPKTVVDFHGTEFTDAGLGRLKLLCRGDVLDLCGTKITDAGLVVGSVASQRTRPRRTVVANGACGNRYCPEGAWIATKRPKRGGSRFSLETGRNERDYPSLNQIH